MLLSHRSRKNLTTLVMYALIGGVVGLAYSMAVGGQAKIGFVTGFAIVGGVFSFELLYVQQPIGAKLRKLPLLHFIVVSTLVWSVIVTICLQIVPRLLGESEAYPDWYQASTFQQDAIFSLVVALFLNAMLRIRSLIGGRVLVNFLIGRYHRPVKEQRIFLFLDLADSTNLAESLGDLRVQSLIRRFFFEIAQPISKYGGETYRYVGDEIIVTWPIEEGVKNANCITCVFEIQKLITSLSHGFVDEYGVVPKFRVGMHCGSIVASEVGDDKREIAYFGDTINTTARLQALCKDKNVDFLVSQELLAMIDMPQWVSLKDIGKVRLRGKNEEIAVFSLTRICV